MDNLSYSQIHLVDLQTKQRTIVHIGPTVGRTESEIILEPSGHPTVHLSFTQVNARQYDAPVLVKRLDQSALEVDGKAVETIAPVLQGSLLSVDGYQYRCELYAWGKLPFRAPLQAAWLTSTGPVREHNEDAIGVYQHKHVSLYAIADGVGGAEAGEIISEFTIQSLLARFHKRLRYDVDWQSVLVEVLEDINADVRRYSRVSAAPAGSTLTAVIIQEWDAYIAHIGDTRLYHYTGGRLRVLTEEHATFSKERKQSMAINKQALHSSKRNVLVKGIGKRDTVEPDTMVVRLQPGDKLVLCSDGIYDHITDEELTAALQTMSPKEVCAHLMRLSEERFNNDNASVLCIDVLSQPKYQRREEQPEAQDRVYIGYKRGWPRKLRAPEEFVTQYHTNARRNRFFKIASLLIVSLIVCALIYIRFVVVPGAGGAALLGLETPTPTFYVVNTPTRTPEPTSTETPTRTPTSTQSPTVVTTLVPVTSTLRPLPTSTLSGGIGG